MAPGPAPAWLEERGDHVVLRLRVQLRAGKDEVVGPTADGFLKVRLAAAPLEGKANRELIRFLAQRLGLARSRLEILSGEKSRHKRVRVDGLPAAEGAARLTRG